MAEPLAALVATGPADAPAMADSTRPPERGASGRSASERREQLVALYRRLRDCDECPLADTRTNLVFGNGDADADLMLVGEAPGFHEDQQGLPFVGRAGQLLDELLAEIGLGRGEVFVANVLKCRPPGNRDPLPEEIEECTPHLMKQIELIEPRVICTLGNFSTRLLSGSRQGITKLCGRALEREIAGRSVRLYPLYHPAAALRSDAVRAELRDHFHRLPELLAEPRPEPAGAPSLSPGLPAAGAAPEDAATEPAPPPQLGLFS